MVSHSAQMICRRAWIGTCVLDTPGAVDPVRCGDSVVESAAKTSGFFAQYKKSSNNDLCSGLVGGRVGPFSSL